MTTAATAGYRQSKRLNAQHGRTYYLATLLLPPHKRPAVHALYGFARFADDIVDADVPRDIAARRLNELQQAFAAGDDEPPLLAAVHETIERWHIPRDLFDCFFRSMRMDLDTTEYATWLDLCDYMQGSAAAIGLQMLPILETQPGLASAAAPYAADLGRAFQLTNFIRDVGEDLRLGRLYLPKEDLAAFGVTRAGLEAGIVDGATRRLLAFEIARARELFRAAEPGIRLLHATSRDCIRTAFVLYRAILDEIEAADYPVLERRVSVGAPKRLRVAVPALVRAWWARRPHHTHHDSVCSASEKPNRMSSTGA
ncbi:MAG TPA: phytoene/squalene synthase family protein [Mycobacteriales bacterium]|nr:phytoene/squalene synthase family protein [Mycobacteriales bacterium]